VVAAVAAGQSCQVAKTFMVSVASVVKWSSASASSTASRVKMGGRRYYPAREDWVLRDRRKPDLSRALLRELTDAAWW
jgi:hypothetical protein